MRTWQSETQKKKRLLRAKPGEPRREETQTERERIIQSGNYAYIGIARRLAARALRSEEEKPRRRGRFTRFTAKLHYI